jgi:hypothetical protein
VNAATAIAAGLLLAMLAGGAARAQDANDLREFHVGMAAAELPTSGYDAFTCTDGPARELDSWADYTHCPADAAGRREISFRFDNAANPMAHLNERFQGTLVAGHPVLLSLLIGSDAHVAAIRIQTDPKARLYLHKKAFLFADQVKARFGAEGWACRKAPPAPDEEPVGGLFMREHCEKTTATRHFILDRDLYRHNGQDLKDFTDQTTLLIERAG